MVAHGEHGHLTPAMGEHTAPSEIAALLGPGERLIWHGRSRPYPALLDAGTTLITLLFPPVTLALLGWLLLSADDRADLVAGLGQMLSAGVAPGFGSNALLLLFALVMLLFLLRFVTAVAATFLRLVAALWHVARRRYAITDQRLLIVEGRNVTMLKSIAWLRLQPGLLGTDIVFGRPTLGAPPTGFYALAEAETVEPLLRQFLTRPQQN